MKKKVTMATLRREVARIHGDNDDTNECFRASVILLAAATGIGTAAPELWRFTRYPRAFVRRIVGEAKQQGIFTADGKICASWFKKDGGLSLIADSLCVVGLMRRANS